MASLNLSSDFSKDNQPAVYFPGHPQKWGDETARLDFPKSDTLPSTIALNDDGSLLAVSVVGDVLIYEFSTLELVRKLHGQRPRSLSSIAFQPGHGRNCKILVGETHTQTDRRLIELIRCWDLTDTDSSGDILTEAAKAATSAAVQTTVERGARSRDDIDQSKVQNSILDVLSTHLDTSNGRTLEGSICDKPFSSDGRFFLRIVRQNNTVVAVDSETLQDRFSLVGHTDTVIWAETSPDASIIATSSWDNTVRLWDATNGQAIRTLTGSTNQSWNGAFSPDGKLVCAGAGDGNVRVWSVESGELLHTLGGFGGWVRSSAFSPDGKFLASGGPGTVRVLDLTTGEETQHWQSNMGGFGLHEARNVFYTSRGLLVFNSSDGLIITYDEKTNQKGQHGYGPDMHGSPRGGKALASVDGKTLIVADIDGSVRFWSLDEVSM